MKWKSNPSNDQALYNGQTGNQPNGQSIPPYETALTYNTNALQYNGSDDYKQKYDFDPVIL